MSATVQWARISFCNPAREGTSVLCTIFGCYGLMERGQLYLFLLMERRHSSLPLEGARRWLVVNNGTINQRQTRTANVLSANCPRVRCPALETGAARASGRGGARSTERDRGRCLGPSCFDRHDKLKHLYDLKGSTADRGGAPGARHRCSGRGVPWAGAAGFRLMCSII